MEREERAQKKMLFAPNAQEGADECDAGTRKREFQPLRTSAKGEVIVDTLRVWRRRPRIKDSKDDWELQRTSHDTVDRHFRKSLSLSRRNTVAERLSDSATARKQRLVNLTPLHRRPTVTKIGVAPMEFSPARRRILPNREVLRYHRLTGRNSGG